MKNLNIIFALVLLAGSVAQAGNLSCFKLLQFLGIVQDMSSLEALNHLDEIITTTNWKPKETRDGSDGGPTIRQRFESNKAVHDVETVLEELPADSTNPIVMAMRERSAQSFSRIKSNSNLKYLAMGEWGPVILETSSILRQGLTELNNGWSNFPEPLPDVPMTPENRSKLLKGEITQIFDIKKVEAYLRLSSFKKRNAFLRRSAYYFSRDQSAYLIASSFGVAANTTLWQRESSKIDIDSIRRKGPIAGIVDTVGNDLDHQYHIALEISELREARYLTFNDSPVNTSSPELQARLNAFRATADSTRGVNFDKLKEIAFLISGPELATHATNLIKFPDSLYTYAKLFDSTSLSPEDIQKVTDYAHVKFLESVKAEVAAFDRRTGPTIRQIGDVTGQYARQYDDLVSSAPAAWKQFTSECCGKELAQSNLAKRSKKVQEQIDIDKAKIDSLVALNPRTLRLQLFDSSIYDRISGFKTSGSTGSKKWSSRLIEMILNGPG